MDKSVFDIKQKEVRMKIWWHHAMPYAEVYQTYDEILRKHTDMLSRNGKMIAVDHYWNKKGSPALQYHCLDVKNRAYCVEAMIEAEEKGYDAAVIGCSMDIGVTESKEVVTIPVVGLAEASMLCACLLGNSFCQITFGQKLKTRIEERASEIGLEKKLVSVRAIEMGLEEAGQALANPKYTQKLKELFIKESKKAIEKDEAEVVIPGCGVLAALCIRQRISVIEGTQVPVVDGVIAALGMAMTLATLKNKAGVTVSRAGTFASPSQEAIKEARKDYQ